MWTKIEDAWFRYKRNKLFQWIFSIAVALFGSAVFLMPGIIIDLISTRSMEPSIVAIIVASVAIWMFVGALIFLIYLIKEWIFE